MINASDVSAARRILVFNAGSSSIKCGVYQATALQPARLARVHADLRDATLQLTVEGAADSRVAEYPRPAAAWDAAMAIVLERAMTLAGGPIAAVGHRVVHGGGRFERPVFVSPEVLDALAGFESLAPLHQPQNVAGIRAAAAAFPAAVQVACFDTAFHHTCPPVATRLAIPRAWHDRGIRRYGFHGLSYESVVGRLPEVTGRMPERAVIAHLGAGASLCGVQHGQSIATTMGFTPLDGLVMATRSGSIDPGAVLHLVLREGLSAAAVETLLSHESGLLGVSGISGDMRVLVESDDPRAAEAVELFCERAARETASLAVALGGLDTIVFTAGIGEHSAEIRRRIAAKLAWLGLELDAAANAAHGPRISGGHSRVAAWVIPTDEEGVIAAHAAAVLGATASRR
ncbi:MAG: acetate/propionate family kinase [Planctomycetota bacterium]